MSQSATTLPGIAVREHYFDCPLDHDRPSAGTIRVFARELVAERRVADELPWLVFLQGGPGFGAPRPFGVSGWIGRALDRYRVLEP